MDYKRIIKSRNVRLKILEILSFVPDSWMIRLQYRIKMKRRLNLRKPLRYTEKLQWYKLYYRNTEMVRCVDKADVRSFVTERGLEHILNEVYGVYISPYEINYDMLPNEFVLKDTLGSGGNSIVLCRDKSKLKIDALNRILLEWVQVDRSKKAGGREWPYYSGKNSRIIVERFINDEDDQALRDYKFFCFNGEPYCMFTLINDAESFGGGRCAFFDMNFEPLNIYRSDYARLTEKVKKPENFELMIEYAKRLSKGFPHVRVDFYNVKGKIIFGELTFFNASGYFSFEPDEFDYKLGEQFQI